MVINKRDTAVFEKEQAAIIEQTNQFMLRNEATIAAQSNVSRAAEATFNSAAVLN